LLHVGGAAGGVGRDADEAADLGFDDAEGGHGTFLDRIDRMDRKKF
jgi:hypothetical protein